MDMLANLLNATAFTAWQQTISISELIGFMTGALCVWGVTRQYTWNWPVGLANNIVFLGLFYSAGLYADALLQAIFAALSVYGWISWSRRTSHATATATATASTPTTATTPNAKTATTTSATATPRIRRATTSNIALALAAGAAILSAAGIGLTLFTDSTVPWPDAFVLAASLIATWGQAKKVLEQWWIWIAVDLVSIPLYIYKGLWLTALLYLGFLALCVYGYRRWLQDFQQNQQRPQEPLKTTTATQVKEAVR